MSGPLPRIGPFDLIEPLGRGGMGEVWRARHTDGSPVAVKLLAASVARDRWYREAFADEVRAVARLDHAHVVTVYDQGRLDNDVPGMMTTDGQVPTIRAGSPWLAMELLDGAPLSRSRGQLPWEDLRARLLELLSALAHAHARGLLHRDIKPGNVHLASRGTVLLDFGLAIPLDRALDPTHMGDVIGTAAYMAPEQIAGRDLEQGPWTDLYALGCTAWSALCGEPPFGLHHAHGVLSHAHQFRPPPPLAPLIDVPPELEGWLRRLLEKDPGSRFQRAADAAVALSGLGSPPVEASLPADWRRPPRPWRRPLGTGLGLFGMRPVPLVDRVAERDVLWRALAGLRRLDVRAVVLQGAPGTGKSALADWVCQRAEESGAAAVLRVDHERDGGPAHGLGPALARYLRCQGLSEEILQTRLLWALRRQGLEPDQRLAELAALNGLVGRGAFAGSAERHAALRRFASRESHRRPLILRIEDAQWGPDALAFAVHLLTHDPAPVLVLVTSRDLDPERPEAELLRRLLAAPTSRRLEIGPLPPGWRPRLLEALIGLEGALAEGVLERTGGHPLFTVQLVEDWVGRGILVPGRTGFRLAEGADPTLPVDIHELWQRRLDRALEGQGPLERSALELAAVLGMRVERSEWSAACRLAGSSASEDLVDALLGAGLVSVDPRGAHAGFAFVHGMLRDSLLRAATEAGRIEALHRAAAAMLEERGTRPGVDTAALALRLGRHRLACGDVEEAIEPLSDGAWRCVRDSEYLMAELALAEREAAVERLDLPPADRRPAEGWLMAARVARRRGKPEEAAAWSARVESSARAQGWDDLLCQALRERARSAWAVGQRRAATEAVQEAVGAATRAGDDPAEAWCLRDLGLLLVESGARPEEAGPPLRRAAAAFASRREVFGEATCLLHLGISLARVKADAAPELRAAETALIAALEVQEPAQSYAALGDVAWWRGDAPLAERHYRTALARFADIGSQGTDGARLGLARSLLAQGRFEEARPGLETLTREVTSRGHAPEAVTLHALRTWWAALADKQPVAAHLISAADSAWSQCTEPDAASAEALEAAAAILRPDLAARARKLAARMWRAMGRTDRDGP